MSLGLQRRVPFAHASGLALASYVVFAVQMTVLLLDNRATWSGWTPELLASSTMSMILGASVVATVGAYVFSIPRSNGMRDYLKASGASPFRPIWPMLGVVALPPALAYLTVLAVVFVVEGRRVGWSGGSAWAALVLLPVLASIAAYAAAGAVLGWYLPRWVAVSLGALGGYVGYSMPTYFLAWENGPLPAALEGTITVVDLSDWATSIPHPVTVWFQALLFAVGAWMLCSAIVSVTSTSTRAAFMAWLLVWSGYLWTAGSTVPIVHAAEPVCAGENPRVCVGASFEAALDDFHSLTALAIERLPADLRPREVRSEDLVSIFDIPADVLVFSPIDGKTAPARTVNQRATTAALLNAVIDQRCDSGPGEVDGEASAGATAYWLTVNDLPLTGGNYIGDGDLTAYVENAQVIAAATRAARAADGAGASWFASQLRALGCPAS